MFNVRLETDLTNWSSYFRFGYEPVETRPSNSDWNDVWCQMEPNGVKLIVVSTPSEKEAKSVLNAIQDCLQDGATDCDLRSREAQWRDKGMWAVKKPDSSVTKEEAERRGAVPIQEVTNTIRTRPSEEHSTPTETKSSIKVRPTRRRM